MPAIDIQEFDVRFMGEEASTLFVEPIFTDDDIVSDFRVIPNVTTKKKLAFITEMEKIVRRYSGCGFNPVPGFKLYDRFIEVDRAKADVEMCWEEFMDTVYEELLKKKTSLPDLTGTQLMSIAENMLRNAIAKDNLRLAFFGNRSSSNAAYDVTDGLWTVHVKDLVTASAMPYFNTGSGSALGAGDGIDTLKAVYAQQALQLKGLPAAQKKFYVTGSIYDAYRDDIENGGGGDFGLLTQINGVEMLRFRGIEVKAMRSWDEIMANDLAQANAHLCLLTTPKNNVFATDVTDREAEVRMWYDDKDEMVRMKARWKMGFNIVHPSLMSVGY